MSLAILLYVTPPHTLITSESPRPTRARPQEHGLCLITAADVRERNRREQRQREQAAFQRNVKRHARAHMKRQGRASMHAEMTLFT